MADNNLIPISDEQAKLGQEVVGAGREFGGYLADILGDLPKDLAGLLVGDQVKAWRAARLAKLWNKVQQRIEERGIKEPIAPNPKLAIPILAAAADEDSEALQNLWEGLLAAAMDPNRSSRVRQAFIKTIKLFDPLDALILQELRNSSGKLQPNSRDFFASKLQVPAPDIAITVRNLMMLECVAPHALSGGSQQEPADFYITTYGRELIRACSD